MNQNQNIPVFVISLERASARRESIRQYLKNLSIEYRLIDAVDGAAMSVEDINAIVAEGVKTHPGAVGCYLSHLKVYEIMKKENIPVALILEDDARVNPDFAPILKQGILFTDWDYCFLDSDDHNDKGPIFYDADSGQNIGGKFRAYELSGGPQTLHAYMISLKAASKRLEHAFPLMKSIDLYDHLPYPIKFYAVVSPKAAWVSEHSLESFTSAKNTSIKDLSFLALRRWPIFYRFRDFITFKTFKRKLLIKTFQNSGQLPVNRRWKSLPFGREVLIR